jgi:hypothetical protein
LKHTIKTHSFLSLAGIAGAAIFLIVLLALDILQLKNSGIVLTVSELVHTSVGWLQSASFVLFGILFFAFVLKLFLFTGRKFSSIAGTAFFGLTSIGMILIATVPDQTSMEILHNSFAGLICASFMTGCIAFAVHFMQEPRWKKYSFFTIATLLVSLTFALLWALLPAKLHLAGVNEQLLFTSSIVWVSVISVKLFKDHMTPAPDMALAPVRIPEDER